MPEIAVVGSLNLDTTMRVPRLPEPGETVLGTGPLEDTGGKGANQAVAAARLGRSVAMVGMVGEDEAGRRLLAALTDAGVSVDTVAVAGAGASGAALITVAADGENTIVVDPGANGEFGPEAFSAAAATVAEADLVLLQLEIPMRTVAAAVAAATGTVVLNPAPAAKIPETTLKRVDVLVLNATELSRLASGPVPTSVDEAADLARRLAGPEAVVVTLGAAGAVVLDGAATTHVPAPRVEAVDPTAAGDAFCAGLADAIVRGDPLVGAVRWAVHCGAVAATRWGAQASLPSAAEVQRLVEQS